MPSRDTHLYLISCVFCILISTALLATHLISESTWQFVVIGLFGSNSLGGAISAFRPKT